MSAAPERSNRISSRFRVHAPGFPSSSACTRLPVPAGLTRRGFRKSRSWRLGIEPKGAARLAAVGVGRARSELAVLCMLRSTVDPPRWFSLVRTRRQRVWRFFRRKAGILAQTSRLQPGASPRRPAPGPYRVSVAHSIPSVRLTRPRPSTFTVWPHRFSRCEPRCRRHVNLRARRRMRRHRYRAAAGSCSG
jgi:hypothetical protein